MSNFFQSISKGLVSGLSKAGKKIKGVGSKLEKSGLKAVGSVAHAASNALKDRLGGVEAVNEVLANGKAFSSDLLSVLPSDVKKTLGTSPILAPGREFLENQQLANDIAEGNKQLTIKRAEKLFPLISTMNAAVRVSSELDKAGKKRVQEKMLNELYGMMESWANSTPLLFGPVHAATHAAMGE